MSVEEVEIIRCPAELRAEALRLVLCELAPSLRRDIAGSLLDSDDPHELANEALFIARRGPELRGAAWGQRQSGDIAVFWPPQLEAGEAPSTAEQLAESTVGAL